MTVGFSGATAGFPGAAARVSARVSTRVSARVAAGVSARVATGMAARVTAGAVLEGSAERTAELPVEFLAGTLLRPALVLVAGMLPSAARAVIPAAPKFPAFDESFGGTVVLESAQFHPPPCQRWYYIMRTCPSPTETLAGHASKKSGVNYVPAALEPADRFRIAALQAARFSHRKASAAARSSKKVSSRSW